MPSAETVSKALEQIRKRPANHEYFFSKLNSVDWIEPLNQAGLFSAPPPAVRERDTISFPFWPESQYLARVASDAPEKVAAVMMKIPDTDNVRVHEDLARAAVKLPANLAAGWARKEAAWIERQEHLYFFIPELLGELIAYLANSGEARVALSLARTVLSVRSDEDNSGRAYARFDALDYERLLQKHFPEVLRGTPKEGFELLCDLLDDILSAKSANDEDYSWIWRPAIEPHPQNLGRGDLRQILIDAIRDGSMQLIHSDHELEVVLQVLLGRKRVIFKRLALHLLSENPTYPAAKTLASERENFFDERLRHEYGRLLSAVFSEFNERQKNSIFSWIEEGRSRAGHNDEEDPELRRKQKAYWQAQRLFRLRGQLPKKWEQRYSDIVAELGEPEHPDFVSYMTSWTGPTSPKDASELEAMSADDIASFFKTWKPTYDWRTPTPEGLGRVFQSVVAASSDRFVKTLDSFRDVDPTYARALVQGLNEAVKAGKEIDWAALLDYLAWVVGQPRDEVRDSSGMLDRDPHWGWARKTVVSLLSTGFEKDSIGFSLRKRAWQIIETVASDPDPTTEDDETSTMDPAMQSINTTRGEALHAVVRYALWVRRAMIENHSTPRPSSFDMNSIPEVRACLELHLHPGVDPSPAIRAVFGQWFPWLVLLDTGWAESRVNSIFPIDNQVLRDAAWRTYLEFCPVYNETFRVLRRQYDAGVDRLIHGDQKRGRHERSGESLGEHLLAMVGRGVLAWDDENRMVKRFFEHATVSDASHAIAFVGRSLLNETNSVPAEVVQRFRFVWEELMSQVLGGGSSERAQLLKPFGWWFISGCFDRDWAFQQMIRVIEAAGEVEPDSMVMERLGELAGEFPSRCLEVLKALVRQNKRGWHLLDWKGSARIVLQSALEAEATKADATALIHELGARGQFQFRSLLSA